MSECPTPDHLIGNAWACVVISLRMANGTRTSCTRRWRLPIQLGDPRTWPAWRASTRLAIGRRTAWTAPAANRGAAFESEIGVGWLMLVVAFDAASLRHSPNSEDAQNRVLRNYDLALSGHNARLKPISRAPGHMSRPSASPKAIDRCCPDGIPDPPGIARLSNSNRLAGSALGWRRRTVLPPMDNRPDRAGVYRPVPRNPNLVTARVGRPFDRQRREARPIWL